MIPLPLRTVRPFVMDEVVLTEVAEEVGFDVTDQMEITKYLKGRVRTRSPYLVTSCIVLTKIYFSNRSTS